MSSEALCPICVGKMDDTDLHFAPCTCGYRMCAFCFAKITENDNPSCPACRKPYDLSAIAVPVKSSLPSSPSHSNNHHKSKSKTKSKRNNQKSDTHGHHNGSNSKGGGGGGEMDPNPHHSLLSYDELSNIRVRQRNLVYVVGLPLPLCDEQVLKSKTWFGGFGKIKKVHCNKKTSHASKNGSCAAYITFYRENDAKRAIESMNGRYLDDGVRMLKATTGSTKYCSYFLSGSSCSNPSKCLFLHDWANKEDVVTKGELNDFGPVSYGGHGHHHTNGYGHHNGHHNAVTLHSGHQHAEYEDEFEFEEEQRRSTNRTVLSVGLGKKAKSSASSKISKFDYTKIVKQSMIKEQQPNTSINTTPNCNGNSNGSTSLVANGGAPKTPRSAAKVLSSSATSSPKNKNGSITNMNGSFNGNIHSNHNGVSHAVSMTANNQHTNSHSNSASSTSGPSAPDHAFPPLGTLRGSQSTPSMVTPFSATPSPMMTGNGINGPSNGHRYVHSNHNGVVHSNGSLGSSPSKAAGSGSMVKTPPVKPLKTRTKPPMGLRKQQNQINSGSLSVSVSVSGSGGTSGSALHNGYSHLNGHAQASKSTVYGSNLSINGTVATNVDHSSTVSGRMQSQSLSKSEKLTSQNHATTEGIPPQISLDDNSARSPHSNRYQNKSVNFDNYVDIVSGESHGVHVESKVTMKQNCVHHQNGKMMKPPRSRSQSGGHHDHGHRQREDIGGSRSKPTTPKKARMKKQKLHAQESHGEIAKVLLEELMHFDYGMMLEDGDGSDSGSDYEEFKMSDLLRDGMWTSDELMMEQYNYYYFVQSEQVIFEQFHHFNAQKAQKSVKSKA